MYKVFTKKIVPMMDTNKSVKLAVEIIVKKLFRNMRSSKRILLK